MVTTVTFQLDELYFAGTHVYEAQADAELTDVVSDAVRAGGVDVFGLTMTPTVADGSQIVHWNVSVTVPTSNLGALAARHASSAFVASIESNSNTIGGSHVNSLYQLSGGVDASAGSVLAIAPPPPPPPV
tara:strand:- start:408 stop:797 length:390 start_codon:yes stop_codon:yes gene_type:complete